MTIVARNLSDQIYDLVRERIVSGALRADSPVRQDALAAELGVSKIPLREAMARLEQDGLVLSRANRGYVVRALSRDEAEEAFALRLKIEPDAAAMASTLATPTDRRASKRALDELARAARSDRARVGRLNREFHMSLVRPLKRPITLQMVERLNILCERYVGKHLEPAGRKDRAQREHAALQERWAQGDAEAVAEMMRAHIGNTLEDLRKQFEIGADTA